MENNQVTEVTTTNTIDAGKSKSVQAVELAGIAVGYGACLMLGATLMEKASSLIVDKVVPRIKERKDRRKAKAKEKKLKKTPKKLEKSED